MSISLCEQKIEGQREWGTGDLLSLLIAAKGPDGSPAFSPAEVHDEVHIWPTDTS